MKICWDGQEKSHQNIFKKQKFQSVWNLKLLSPPFVFPLLKESLLFQDMEHDRQHQLCPEKGRIPLNSSEHFHHWQRKRIIYTSTIAPPSLFSILQWAGEETANKFDFLLSGKSHFSTHQYPCNPLYTFCTDPCFSNCLRPAKERKASLHSTNRRTLHLVFLLHLHIRLRDPLWLSPFK